MLQVITGKFFDTADLHETNHRGILYTNYRQRESIETCVGRLLPTAPMRAVQPAAYEVTERLPRTTPDGQDSVLIAVGIQPLLQDFAALASFCLNVTMSPREPLVTRLIADREPPLGIPQLPKKYVGRVFDRSVRQRPHDADRLQEFSESVVALERRAYERAMRAIRQYVMGLHRIADDLSLAYAMLVSSIESLAQDFGAFEPSWTDVEGGKRKAIDKVLEDTEEGVSDEVHRVLLEHEHLALSRRFVEFTLAHVDPSFFREEARDEYRPIRRSALPLSLKRAYSFRSRYLHVVEKLPRQLSHVASLGDVWEIDHRPVLTLHGLARIGRHVIQRFVERAPKLEAEDFDYRQALPNVVSMPLAPRYWIGRAGGYNHVSANRYLSGFLRELADSFRGRLESRLTDLASVLEKVEKDVPGLALREQRLPMLTLYRLWNRHILEEHRRPNWQRVLDQFQDDFEEPGVESLLVHALAREECPWAVAQSDRAWKAYVDQRHHRNGLAIPPFFECVICLSLAEQCRANGDQQGVNLWIGRAIEALPGEDQLIELERMTEPVEDMPEIDWREILLVEEESSKDGPG